MAGLDEILGDAWVAQQRERGAAIMVCGLSGRIHHADPAVKQLVKRDALPNNAFDLIAPGHTLKASALVARHLGRHIRTRFPLTDDSGNPQWVRFEVTWPHLMIAMALWPEDDPQHHHIQAERL